MNALRDAASQHQRRGSTPTAGTGRSSPDMGTCTRTSAMGKCSSTPVPQGCPVNTEYGAGAGVALPQGTAAPTPSGTSLGISSIFLLLHSQCLSMSTPCSSTPGDFEALFVLLKLTGWFAEHRDAGLYHEPIIHPMSGWAGTAGYWRGGTGALPGFILPCHTPVSLEILGGAN